VQKALTNGECSRRAVELDGLGADAAVEAARRTSGFNAKQSWPTGGIQSELRRRSANVYQSPLGANRRHRLASPFRSCSGGAGNALGPKRQSAKDRIESQTRGFVVTGVAGENARAPRPARDPGGAFRSRFAAQKPTHRPAIAYAIARNQYSTGSGNLQISDLLLIQQSKDQAATAYLSQISNFWRQYYQLQKITLYDFINRVRHQGNRDFPVERLAKSRRFLGAFLDHARPHEPARWTRHLLKTTSFMLVTMVFSDAVLPHRPLLGRSAWNDLDPPPVRYRGQHDLHRPRA